MALEQVKECWRATGHVPAVLVILVAAARAGFGSGGRVSVAERRQNRPQISLTVGARYKMEGTRTNMGMALMLKILLLSVVGPW